MSSGTFHVVLDFPCSLFIAKHCYFPNSASKEIQKYDQRKLYFFSEKKHFQIWHSRSSLKKKSQTPKLQNKKIRNKQNFE